MFFKKRNILADGRLRNVRGAKVKNLLDSSTLEAVSTGRGAVFNKAGEAVPLEYRSTGEGLQVRFF